jgi:hypothetical protein
MSGEFYRANNKIFIAVNNVNDRGKGGYFAIL